MPDAPADGPAVARARLLGKRAGLAVVIVVAVAFIGASAVQIVGAVFGLRVAPLATGPGGPAARACASGVRELERALDRASALALSAAPGGGAADRGALGAFRQGLSPEWDAADDVARACAGAPGGLDAWAALERLRAAEEQLACRGRVELAPMRGDVAAHLPAELR